jgi:hypothetical protein
VDAVWTAGSERREPMSESFKLPPGWDPVRTSQQLGALAAASTDMVAAWSKAWQAVIEQRGEPALRAMLDPAAWATDGEHDPEAVLERWLGVPRFADLLVDPEALRRGLPAIELAQVAGAYAQAALRVWSETCQRFQQQLAAAETRPEGPGEALDLWNAAVDETLMRFHRYTTGRAPAAARCSRDTHACLRDRGRGDAVSLGRATSPDEIDYVLTRLRSVLT